MHSLLFRRRNRYVDVDEGSPNGCCGSPPRAMAATSGSRGNCASARASVLTRRRTQRLRQTGRLRTTKATRIRSATALLMTPTNASDHLTCSAPGNVHMRTERLFYATVNITLISNGDVSRTVPNFMVFHGFRSRGLSAASTGTCHAVDRALCRQVPPLAVVAVEQSAGVLPRAWTSAVR